MLSSEEKIGLSKKVQGKVQGNAQKAALVIAVLIGLLFESGCSTSRVFPEASPSGRKGFLDRVKAAGSPRSRGSQREVASRTPIRIHQALPAKTLREKSESRPAVELESKPETQLVNRRTGFQWPLKDVSITSTYGRRGRQFHDGLDLKAKDGTPVYAAKAGVVLYASTGIRGYGQLVVLRHTGKVSTIYAHNSRILVRRGQRIRQGQLIAYSGSTGRVTGPHVHFEIRRGLSAINPLPLMPPVRSLSASQGGKTRAARGTPAKRG